jgi:hypothetical protein
MLKKREKTIIKIMSYRVCQDKWGAIGKRGVVAQGCNA